MVYIVGLLIEIIVLIDFVIIFIMVWEINIGEIFLGFRLGSDIILFDVVFVGG